MGDEALSKRLVLDLDQTIENGRFKSLDNFDVCGSFSSNSFFIVDDSLIILKEIIYIWVFRIRTKPRGL